jgi:hypothetical protein
VPEPRDRPLRRLQVCPRCAGYMQPLSPFGAAAGTRNWKDETYRRSFGGVEVRKFVCEKCHHVETFQIDDLGHLTEDEK